jgi:hypothetical protein
MMACKYVSAQNVSFTTSANMAKMGSKDDVQVTYTVRGAQSLQSINPSNTGDFVITNGPFQVITPGSISFVYIMHPKHTGKCTILPGVARDAQGHAYQSNPLTIEVVSGSLAATRPHRMGGNPYDDDLFGNGGGDPRVAMMQQMAQAQQQMMQMQMQMQRMQQQRMQQIMRQQQAQQHQQQQASVPMDEKELGKYLFIKVSVDKEKVHVGEQVTASYKLYSRIPMQVGISKLPSLNGFWTQDFERPKEMKPVEEIVDGKKYQVFLLKKSALFPQQTGTLELDPAEAQGVARILQQVRQRYADDPALAGMFGGSLMMNDPFFNNSFFDAVEYKDVQVHLKSTPVNITVTPLPDKDKPASFGGAVGDFTVNSSVNNSSLSTDDVATYTININGSGNLKLIETPKLNLPNGLETFDPQIVDTITGRTNTISGSKIITYSITPHTPGDYVIPAIPFSYYNPATGKYVSVEIPAAKLHVIAGKHYNADVAKTGNLTDIHNIATTPLNSLVLNAQPLLFTGTYWSLYVLPLFLFIGIVAWKRREEELSKDVVKLRNKRANKIALKRLTTAKALLQQNSEKPFYEEISKAIWLYLSDKLNIPLSALSRESARATLTSRNVPEALQVRMEKVLDECETSLYAPIGGAKQMNHIYSETVDIISELEDNI